MARIPIPRNVENVIDLFNDVYSKHQLDGISSPLKDIFEMDVLNAKNEQAETLHDNALKANRSKENFGEQRDNELRIVRKEVRRIRDYLLALFPGNPHALGDWGFEVQGTETGEEPEEGELYDSVLITDQRIAPGAFAISLKSIVGKSGKIMWGDGTEDDITHDGTMQVFSHNYTVAGIYTVTIKTTNDLLGIIAQNCKLTGVPAIATELVNIESIDMPGNQLTTFPNLSTFVKLKIFNLFNNNLTEVDSYIITINSFQTYDGEIILAGGNNSLPNGTTAPVIQALIARGWTVTTSHL